jgi:SAM-dependent methyltransferase
VRLGLQVYEPDPESLPRLDELTVYVEDPRSIDDDRPTTASEDLPDLTLLPDALGTVVDVERFRGVRVLEVGPKYGVHARWIDRELRPSEVVFSDFESDTHLHEEWIDAITTPHRFVYGDLSRAETLLESEPFDLVFFLGVLYHSIHHLPLLGMLNRVTKPGGTMLFETTVDPRPDALVRLRWPANGKAKGVPTIQAVRLELAWTGWR